MKRWILLTGEETVPPICVPCLGGGVRKGTNICVRSERGRVTEVGLTWTTDSSRTSGQAAAISVRTHQLISSMVSEKRDRPYLDKYPHSAQYRSILLGTKPRAL